MANNTPSYASSALPKISLKSITPELFADTAAKKAAEMAAQMAELLSAHGL